MAPTLKADAVPELPLKDVCSSRLPRARGCKGGFAAIWAGLYMLFYNMPRAPEFFNCFNNAWIIGLTLNDTHSAKGEDRARWINLYRTDTLQPGAMRAQLDYYRAMMQLGAATKMENWLSASNPIQLPVLLIRGKQDIALVREVYTATKTSSQK